MWGEQYRCVVAYRLRWSPVQGLHKPSRCVSPLVQPCVFKSWSDVAVMDRCCLHMTFLQAPTAPARASTLCDRTWPATLSEGMAACHATRTTFTSPQGPAMALWCEANPLPSLSLRPSLSHYHQACVFLLMCRWFFVKC